VTVRDRVVQMAIDVLLLLFRIDGAHVFRNLFGKDFVGPLTSFHVYWLLFSWRHIRVNPGK
jgi:hypothetical protein